MDNSELWRENLTEARIARFREFAKDKQTPFLVLDLDIIAERYNELQSLLPSAKVFYAVKANPQDEVLQTLAACGSSFDIASRYEMDQALSLGVKPDRISFGNTIKKEEDIAYAYSKGIRLYTTDSESDVEKLARSAPGSKVVFRLLLDSSGEADWPLTRKFGAHPDMLYGLIKLAKEKGLDPYGISFHVGSQQRDVGQWDSAIALCKYLFESLRQDDIRLRAINLGGGFPAHYIQPTAETKDYAEQITRYLKEDFGEEELDIILEPGRSIAGDSGMIATEVVLIANKSETLNTRWVYLDVGKFNGLIETLDEAIKYPILVEGQHDTDDVGEVVLAGPTCDSADILYENFKYTLPNSLKEGDRLSFFSTGAYTTSYCSINFNGFPPLKVYILPKK